MNVLFKNLHFRENIERFLMRGISTAKENQPRAQTRESWESPFVTQFNSYEPLRHNLDLYDVMREAIPILDVTVQKLIRLIGNFRIETFGNDNLKKFLDDFITNVQVNWFGQGFNSWIVQLSESALAKGMGFGEVVPLASMTGVHRLKIAKANHFRFVKDGNGLALGYISQQNFTPVKIQKQEFIHYLAFDLRDGEPQGYSLFYSLPFVSQIFIRIEKAIENQIWRVGDPSFLIVVEGGAQASDRLVASLASKIQDQVTNVMQDRRQGKTRDIHAGAPFETKVHVKVLGGDSEIMNLEIPIHTILEQIISRTGFPPFMFGLYKWTSTERMSTHQNDMIVSNIESYRAMLDPVITKVIDTALILNGYVGAKWKHEWNPVNLMDEVEQAKARHLNAAALEKELKALEFLLMYGLIDDEEVQEYLATIGFGQKMPDERMAVILEKHKQRVKMIHAGEIMKGLYGTEIYVPTNGKAEKKKAAVIENEF